MPTFEMSVNSCFSLAFPARMLHHFSFSADEQDEGPFLPFPWAEVLPRSRTATGEGRCCSSALIRHSHLVGKEHEHATR